MEPTLLLSAKIAFVLFALITTLGLVGEILIAVWLVLRVRLFRSIIFTVYATCCQDCTEAFVWALLLMLFVLWMVRCFEAFDGVDSRYDLYLLDRDGPDLEAR